MGGDVDFAAEGLLDGLGGQARQGREKLLRRLVDEGVSLQELREATAEGRLVVLGVERVLTGKERYTPRELAAEAGVSLELLESQWRALGMVVADPDARSRTEEDRESAKRLGVLLEAGLDPEAVAEIARLMAMAMAQVVAANRQMVGEMLAAADGEGAETSSEEEVAGRLEDLARSLIPTIGPTLEYVYRLQLREQLRNAALDTQALASGEVPAGDEMAVAFADLVGFTRLGEHLPPEDFGRITRTFAALAGEVAVGPVRLVKLIGDAAMLASVDPAALADATLELIARVEGQGQGFPPLRAGLSLGTVLPRGGDLYGRTVNLASRLTGAARPGSLLVSAEVRDRLEGEFNFSDAGRKRLKGIGHPVHVFRCRDLPADVDDAGTAERPARSRGRRRR
jgi:adenylate cyclase